MISGVLQVIMLFMRASLAVVLVAAGAAKLADTRSFAVTLMGLGVPVRRQLFLRGFAIIVPLTELALGLAIISGLWPTIVNGAVFALMCGFSLVVIIALRRKLNVACRCFGALSDSQFSRIGLLRSLLLTILAFAVFWSGNVYSVEFSNSPGLSILLVAGFLLFALAAAQAARTIAILKESMS